MSHYITPKILAGYVAPEYMMLIDGAWQKSQSGETSSRLAPGHGTIVGRYQSATVADAKLAIASARKAFDHGPWPRMKAAERSKFLHKVADLIEQNREKIAHLDTIECGKPIQQVLSEIDGAIDIWRYAASLARTLYGESYNNLGEHTLGIVLREPIGVVSIITPWNFPY